MKAESQIPKLGVVTDIRVDTPDIKTFRVTAPGGGRVIEHRLPGQCAMLSIPGVGEAMFSITSSPTQTEYHEFSIKKCGHLTNWLHAMEPGQQITVRGPYGNGFPVDGELKGKDLLFVAGGVGFAPLHSVIRYVLDNRADFGKVNVIYGARSADDLLDLDEIQNDWLKRGDIGVHLTIDRPQDKWPGHVGFVPNYVTELGFDPQGNVLVCGPPIMIKFTLQALTALGWRKEQVFTTMELRMKCGIGKCGRCNIGDKYVCKDGPVFRFDELDGLTGEY